MESVYVKSRTIYLAFDIASTIRSAGDGCALSNISDMIGLCLREKRCNSKLSSAFMHGKNKGVNFAL